MDRHLTDEELEKSEIAELLYLVGSALLEEVKEGDLKGCTLYRPCITDGPVVSTMNDILHEDSDFMYYLQIESSGNFIEEAKAIKPLVIKLDDALEDEDGKGLIFDNGRELLTINCVTTEHEDKFYHMIIFLMKESNSDSELVS